MALTPTDVTLAGYHLFLAVLILVRGPVTAGHGWVLLACVLFGGLLVAIRLNRRATRLGRLLHTFYPLMLFAGMYTALGTLNAALPPGQIPGNEALAQGWEVALFGGQPSYDLIRRYPSVFLSGLLHLAYFAYYPTILLPGPYLAARGDWTGARRVVGATITAFVLCYVVFALFPVAGPNWVFDHPTGPVREVWSARLVYGILGLGSSVGTAFPSSHVAATFATVIAAYQVRRSLGWITLVPFVLLTISVVYCQMHYVVDAIGGLVLGGVAGSVAGAAWVRTTTLRPRGPRPQTSDGMPTRFLIVLAATSTLTGCALLGFGPKMAVVEGTVYLADDASVIPHAEVCAFGLDTTCVRADAKGNYRMRRVEQTVSLRFRAGQVPPATSDTLHLVPPGRYRVDCAISGRLVISDRPQPCQPAPAR